jgi:hypothetical protein
MEELLDKHAPMFGDSASDGRLGLLRQCVIAAATVYLCACSGGSGDSDSASGDSQELGVQEGFFRGGNVAGLDFVSGAQKGTTDESGAYACETDRLVTFSVGSVTLGETDCASVAHAAALTESGLPTDRVALNIVRFLMMLDQDQDPENGIFISEPLRSVAPSWNQLDFSVDDFESELYQVASDIASIEPRVPSVPDKVAAFEFLDTSLSCAYSGVYISRFQGETGLPLNAALSIFRDPATNVDAGEFFLIRQDWPLPVFLNSTSKLMLETLPHVADNATFFADFVSPDQVMGSWRDAITVENADRTGDFDVIRVGFVDGKYRFVGTLTVPLIGISRQLQGRIELLLDGDTLYGREFDLLLGVKLPVTGKRLADSNRFEIEVSNLGTAEVTVILDTDGEPIALEGNWPGYEDNVLEAVGCRLT